MNDFSNEISYKWQLGFILSNHLIFFFFLFFQRKNIELSFESFSTFVFIISYLWIRKEKKKTKHVVNNFENTSKKFFSFYSTKGRILNCRLNHSLPSYLKYRIYEYERKRRKRNTFQRCQQLWEYMEKIWEQVPKNIFNAPLKSLKFYQE